MSFTMLEKQLRALPEEYYEEISQYVEYLMFRHENRKKSNTPPVDSNYFGSLKTLSDGMEMQRTARDEWI